MPKSTDTTIATHSAIPCKEFGVEGDAPSESIKDPSTAQKPGRKPGSGPTKFPYSFSFAMWQLLYLRMWHDSSEFDRNIALVQLMERAQRFWPDGVCSREGETPEEQARQKAERAAAIRTGRENPNSRIQLKRRLREAQHQAAAASHRVTLLERQLLAHGITPIQSNRK
jgi:hypothetical protein